MKARIFLPSWKLYFVLPDAAVWSHFSPCSSASPPTPRAFSLLTLRLGAQPPRRGPFCSPSAARLRSSSLRPPQEGGSPAWFLCRGQHVAVPLGSLRKSMSNTLVKEMEGLGDFERDGEDKALQEIMKAIGEWEQLPTIVRRTAPWPEVRLSRCTVTVKLRFQKFFPASLAFLIQVSKSFLFIVYLNHCLNCENFLFQVESLCRFSVVQI